MKRSLISLLSSYAYREVKLERSFMRLMGGAMGGRGGGLVGEPNP